MDVDERSRLQELARMDDLKQIADRPEGRRFFARLFAGARCLSPIYSKSADVYKDAAVQAFALRMWKDIHEGNPEASRLIFDLMMTPADGEEEIEHAY